MKNVFKKLSSKLKFKPYSQKNTAVFTFKIDTADFKYSIAEVIERKILPTGELNDILKKATNLKIIEENDILTVNLKDNVKYRVRFEANHKMTVIDITVGKKRDYFMRFSIQDTYIAAAWSIHKGRYIEEWYPLPKYYKSNNVF
jgi:hypothetical protein